MRAGVPRPGRQAEIFVGVFHLFCLLAEGIK